MSAETTFTRSWPVGTYTATLTMPATAAGALAMNVEWAPEVPKGLTKAELEEYRAGRNAALQAWAVAVGQAVAVMDV